MAIFVFAYSFLSNFALAVIPHEPVIIFSGPRIGIWETALLATAGTVAASLADYRLFAGMISRAGMRLTSISRPARFLVRQFAHAPFAIIAASGITPLPFFPFKVLAFTSRYPLAPYLTAVTLGRLPRYLILAWLGVALELPAWLLIAAFVLLLIPSLRLFLWKHQTAK